MVDKITATIRNRSNISATIPNTRMSGGTSDYDKLKNKPILNGVEISGEHDSAYYGITSFWFGTRTEYNELPVILPNVCYCLREGS